MKWTKKPITWGGYLKLCGITTLISMVITGISVVRIYWDEISGFFERKFERFVHRKD